MDKGEAREIFFSREKNIVLETYRYLKSQKLEKIIINEKNNNNNNGGLI